MSDLGPFDYVVLVVAILILIPVAFSPAGWLIAVIAIAIWVLGAYGARYVLGVEKERRSGERGRIAEIRHRERGDR